MRARALTPNRMLEGGRFVQVVASRRGWLNSAKRSEELADLYRQRLRSLHRRKVPAAVHRGPAMDIRECPLGDGTRWSQDFSRKLAIAGGDCHGLTRWDGPRPMHSRVVGPEGRTDGCREPIQADIRQQVVSGEHRLDVSAAIGPGPKLLHDPSR